MSAPELAAAEILRLAERQAVYRCFAEDGTLLYIGTTGNLGRRLADHAQKIWFLASAKITLEWFPDEESATKAEREAIETEQPKYNVAHNRAMTVQLPSFADRKRSRSPGPELPVVFLSAAARPDGAVTIREALAARMLPGYASSGSVRTAKYRRPGQFPEAVGTQGVEKLYNADALRAWAVTSRQCRAATSDAEEPGCQQ